MSLTRPSSKCQGDGPATTSRWCFQLGTSKPVRQILETNCAEFSESYLYNHIYIYICIHTLYIYMHYNIYITIYIYISSHLGHPVIAGWLIWRLKALQNRKFNSGLYQIPHNAPVALRSALTTSHWLTFWKLGLLLWQLLRKHGLGVATWTFWWAFLIRTHKKPVPNISKHIIGPTPKGEHLDHPESVQKEEWMMDHRSAHLCG